jgi:hypothetical protein
VDKNYTQYQRIPPLSISKEQEGGLFSILRNFDLRNKYECTEIDCPLQSSVGGQGEVVCERKEICVM